MSDQPIQESERWLGMNAEALVREGLRASFDPVHGSDGYPQNFDPPILRKALFVLNGRTAQQLEASVRASNELLFEQREAVAEMRRSRQIQEDIARSTRILAWATFALAVATAVLAYYTWSIAGREEAQIPDGPHIASQDAEDQG